MNSLDNDLNNVNYIWPGVTEVTLKDFEQRVDEIKKISRNFHFDITDGIYAPSKTIGLYALENFSGFEVEVHLMVENPLQYFKEAVSRRVKRVIVHRDALEKNGYIESIKTKEHAEELGLEFTLAFRKEDKIDWDLDLLNFPRILIMTVNIGFKGGEFLEDQVEVIKELYDFHPKCVIVADGHVNDITLPRLRESGVSEFVSTSFLSGANLVENFKILEQLAV